MSRCRSQGATPHPLSLASLSEAKRRNLMSPIADSDSSLNSLKERFDPLHKESQPGYRVIDNFTDRISFFPCNRSDPKERELHLSKLDYLCQNVLKQPNSIVVVTDASVKPNKSLQAVSVAYGWRKGIQVISSKAAFGNITTPNAELVASRLGIAKATSLDVDRIVVITDSLSSAKKALDPSHHSGQSESITIAHLLRPFFNRNSSNKIEFWDCPSKARWHLHAIVDDDAKSTNVPSTPSQFTSLDLRDKSSMH